MGQLRKIAEAADSGNPWEWGGRYPQRILRTGDVVLVADCFEDPDSPSRFAEFIATFDPPTVLRLLDSLQRIADGTYNTGDSYISARQFARNVMYELNSCDPA